MIAVDTNVLLRVLTQDDPAQTERAASLMTGAEAAGEPILVNDVVLVETMWTMSRRYQAPRAQLLDIARSLLDTPSFAFERRGNVERAVSLFERSDADFSDCLIVAKNAAAGCRFTTTFDAECAKLAGTHAA